MKRLSFVIAGLMTAILLASCSGSAGGSGAEEVASSEVISIATESGVQFNETAKPVASKETFEANLLPAISADFDKALDIAMSSLPLGGLTSVKRAAITEADLEASAADLENQINKIATDIEQALTNVMLGKDVSLKIDWKAPVGELKVQDGLDFEIRDAAIKADVSVTSPDNGKTYSASANADFIVDYSATENLKKLCNCDTIPVAKFSVLTDCSADLSGDFNLSSIMLAMMGTTDETALLNSLSSMLESFNGSVNGTVAFSGGLVFNTADFAGVITIDADLSVEEDLNADTLAKYVALAMQAENMAKSGPTKEFFDALPVKASLVVSVYDKDGEKQFDYINANSLYEVYTEAARFDLGF